MLLLRQTLRQLAKSPGFTTITVLTLALGIGANTAIFSVVEAALLRPLPFPEPDRVVRLYEAFDDADTRANTLNLSELTLRDWRAHGRDVLVDVAGATGASLTLGATGAVPPRNVPAARITANFLTVLALPPAMGRNFTATEDQPDGPRVVIVSDDFWRRELNRRPDAIGAQVMLDNAPYTVVGVMPPHFRHPYRADLWLPLGARFEPAGNRGHYLYAVGRLQPHLSLDKANAGLRRMCAAIAHDQPDPNNPLRAYVRPVQEGFVADVKPKLLVIAAAALCTLLIAASNFSGLLLSRAVAHESQTAVRAALGATRGRLIREMLTQALVLAALGTILGLILASWLTPLLVQLSPEGSDATGSAMREFDYSVHLDLPVFAVAAGTLLLIGAGFGLLPAWRVARTDLRSALASASRGATLDSGTQRLLGGLVVAEIAVAAVLLVGSLMLTQHFRKLVNEPWGFSTNHRLTFNAMFSSRLFSDPAARLRTAEQVVAELRTIPGVRSATVMLPHPMNAARQLVSFNVDGVTAPEPRGFFLAYLRSALPGHFATLGQPLLRGRDFSETDRATSPLVCIVNESLARRFWPGKNPIGQRVKMGRLDGPRPWFTVIGVAADTKVIVDANDGEIPGTVVFALPQLLPISASFDELSFVMETAPTAPNLELASRQALARVDSRLAAYDVGTLESLATESRVTERFALVLISLFGALGLVLSAIGLYGLLALQVTRRFREFGVRSALGATAGQIIGLVIKRGAKLLCLGFALGAAAAWAALRIVQAHWPELPDANPRSWLVAAAVLAAATGLACWMPARRASKVDPMIALRSE